MNGHGDGEPSVPVVAVVAGSLAVAAGQGLTWLQLERQRRLIEAKLDSAAVRIEAAAERAALQRPLAQVQAQEHARGEPAHPPIGFWSPFGPWFWSFRS